MRAIDLSTVRECMSESGLVTLRSAELCGAGPVFVICAAVPIPGSPPNVAAMIDENVESEWKYSSRGFRRCGGHDL